MSKAYTGVEEFAAASEQLNEIIEALQSKRMFTLEHGDVEAFIGLEGNELLRRLFQGYLDLRANQEALQKSVTGADGIERRRRRQHTERGLMTLFGEVSVGRVGYSAAGSYSLFPLDAQLNLAVEYSHGLQLRSVEEFVASSFDRSVERITTTTGGKVPKLQMQKLAAQVAQDFESFYESRQDSEPEQTNDFLVLSTDGKGIVMKQDSLRECTQRAAKKEKHKLKTRLSRGEKRNRKRMATVASVYSVAKDIRTPEAVMQVSQDQVREPKPRPQNKRVWASVARAQEQVIEEMFQEANRRDPHKKRHWVMLVDGQPQQLRNIWSAIFRNEVEGTVVVLDFIHVLEYLWKAAYCFAPEGSEEAEKFVQVRALSILRGRASHVAAGMRRAATLRGLTAKEREPVDTCVNYFHKHKDMMRYDRYLENGFPIATGVIEGACRHLIKDRMDITGARWGLETAEAVLKLRSLNSSGDLEEYWKFHKSQELRRNHISRFEPNSPSLAA